MLATNKYMPDYQEYLTLGEEICATLPFKGYYTLKHGSWPKDLDEDYFKGIMKKLMSMKDRWRSMHLAMRRMCA
jgi:hypothetical protein